ncbi:MAG: aminomethyl-transferring glycine dehydrogenase [Chthoniobacterales bacterium]
METLAAPPTAAHSTLNSAAEWPPLDTFARRHIGPDEASQAAMLEAVGAESLDALIDQVVPGKIRLRRALQLPTALGESASLAELKSIASRNQVWKSYLGTGYSDCLTPPVIQRNILENPGWYTAYTPYQAEISQGRMEALLNFQTMIIDLTGLEIANASLLDEGTAAAEAMHLCQSVKNDATSDVIFVSESCHPQTIAVVQTRALPLGIEVIVGDHREFDFTAKPFAVLVQYPATNGAIYDYENFAAQAHAAGALVICAADLLALTLLKPPGEFGADVAVGSSQRFGVPLGFGGPHAAYMATRDAYKRSLPGRLIGVSVDSNGNPAMRLTLQTREQHIRRDKATSNICTAQVLLAVIASTYAVYHGAEGLRDIAKRVHGLTNQLAEALLFRGWKLAHSSYFDTIVIEAGDEQAAIVSRAVEFHINLRQFPNGNLGISLDETTTGEDIALLISIFGEHGGEPTAENEGLPENLRRTSPFLTHPVFNTHHSETELLRYLKRLENRDLSLTTSMIALGSCTMKLNATAEMFPVTWPEFGRIHPHAPREQVAGYLEMFDQLESWLAEITGFAAVSLQPNSGAQGEYAGLLTIRQYHLSRGDAGRTVCLIPTSAHGTNPASAVMAGFKVVPVACDAHGNVNLDDLTAKAELHSAQLGALMITYPSTHGVFEEGIIGICELIHRHGGQVYMDGANMNAQVGVCRPGDFGADVCHLNLHKTFCIPHGGGGPGVGPIGVAAHLAAFLPNNELAVSAATWGSASILVISWMYIRMMGPDGLTSATKHAILNANYISMRLDAFFPTLYRGRNDRVAHECILDVRGFKARTGIEVEDVAKRLIDYGFHAPTMSWPVAGTLMVEPTESESKEELDRFCDAMISIWHEIQQVECGLLDRKNNVLKNAPHTAQCLLSEKWDRPYSRESAAYPTPATRESKFWPHVGRVDNVYGDRNLICSCLPMDSY